MQTCPSFPANATLPCQDVTVSQAEIGCGLLRIAMGGTFDSRAFVYDIMQCADYALCDLCTGGSKPPCNL